MLLLGNRFQLYGFLKWLPVETHVNEFYTFLKCKQLLWDLWISVAERMKFVAQAKIKWDWDQI